MRRPVAAGRSSWTDRKPTRRVTNTRRPRRTSHRPSPTGATHGRKQLDRARGTARQRRDGMAAVLRPPSPIRSRCRCRTCRPADATSCDGFGSRFDAESGHPGGVARPDSRRETDRDRHRRSFGFTAAPIHLDDHRLLRDLHPGRDPLRPVRRDRRRVRHGGPALLARRAHGLRLDRLGDRPFARQVGRRWSSGLLRGPHRARLVLAGDRSSGRGLVHELPPDLDTGRARAHGPTDVARPDHRNARDPNRPGESGPA